MQVECHSRDKGIALVADQAIPKGEFIVQYAGEVISIGEYKLREKALTGGRHYYGVTINSREVIDARNKGTLARFANHSCAPNAELQKWDVNGETCCGLFARADILRGEEITFDGGNVSVAADVAKGLCRSDSVPADRPRAHDINTLEMTTDSPLL
ncbi:hypothetical protein PF005_g13993 [Phytophthora fragariae]|uniref:SET domain-containing protein n=1 Tax=Phytophthora fragariae TaxID=53985 RepID=A0A6A3XJZ0_9STRA|nr:hypothetical protein PF007_g12958 [Phytophthora fragariae]KAE9203922.1 hypothetical protein PF005_g13993 [Phytophthora fragariae]KAE9221737.1 hypothetical protein PF002_g15486 [Phytophthora fragariae]KAE9226327.1 hypothetical protein PF004_g11666 [Phytophthora fragariae]